VSWQAVGSGLFSAVGLGGCAWAGRPPKCVCVCAGWRGEGALHVLHHWARVGKGKRRGEGAAGIA
jgi:hypothetical protein